MHTDLAFLSAHSSDVPLRSRIVAVCGITDVDNLASPELDGWFFSDFYLFHHLFHPICMFCILGVGTDWSFKLTVAFI